MKINVTTILYIGIAVLLVLQFKSCFDKVHKPESMIRNEERLKYLEERRLSDSMASIKYISIIDSLISESKNKSEQLTSQYKGGKVIYVKIPFVVDNLDKEQLRTGANSY